MGLRKLTGQKTYGHLLDAQRRPSLYEIVSSQLHYYPALGFSVDTPIRAWYEKYQSASAFNDLDLEAFSDPRRTTYTSYTQLQNQRETYINGLLDSVVSGDDQALPAAWLDCLAQVFAPLRYPCHGLMMMTGYLSSMAPGSRVTIAAAFQAADEIRRINGLARRLHQLRASHPDLGQDAKHRWQEEPAWQGIRRVIEQSLTVYDWSQCFVTLNLALKPSFDHLCTDTLATRARASGDNITAQLLASLALDTQWQRDWSRELLRLVLEQSPGCRDTVEDWLQRYTPDLDEACDTLSRRVDPTGPGQARQAREDFLAHCGIEARAP